MKPKEAEALTYYQNLIRSYFEDSSEEGRIAKYARMEECYHMLVHFLDIPEKTVKRIYQEEYSNKYLA